MACRDCSQPRTSPRKTREAFHAPQGYTGCALSTLAYALPDDPLPQADYSLPSIDRDGVITYTPSYDGQEPPPAINGYCRDLANLWRFTPLWPECAMRIHGVTRNRKTGCINVVMICNHPEDPEYGRRLVHKHCQACPFRLARNDRQ